MASANVLIRLKFLASGAWGLECGESPQHNGIGVVCPNFGGVTSVRKGGAMLVVVLKGLMGMLQVAMWLILTFFGANDCGIGWPMAGLAVFGGRVGWILFNLAALLVGWFTLGVILRTKGHRFWSKLQLRGRFSALGNGTRRAWGEWTHG